MALSYFINRKKTTCVITFKGSLSPTDNELLGTCLKEATAETFAYMILNLGGINGVDPESARPFTIFQQGLRSGSRLYLCDLAPEPSRILKAQGVVRESETFPDLMACLQAILSEEKGK
jgi:anti-anti-sigma regulatory factor